jgi:amino acid adenylation domain-containing protein
MMKIDGDILAAPAQASSTRKWKPGARVKVERSLLEKRVDDLVWEQARRTPDAIAAVFGDEAISYAQLTARAEHLAGRLRRQGIAPGALVGIHLERSLDMLVAMLSTLRAGAAYVPLDPAFPPQRLHHMVEDSQPGVVIVATDAGTLPGARLLAIHGIDQEITNPAPASAAPGAVDALAYVLYTSGSTGRPKGVAVTHRNLVNLLLSMAQEPGLAPDDVLLAITTLSFDIAALELLLPLLVGARVVIAAAGDSADGERLQELLRRHRVSTMQATPTVWRLLVDSGWSGGTGFKALCGGEALPADLSQSLAQRCELWNMYGPTETTVWSSCYRVPPSGRPVLVGRPIASTRIYVLDKARRPLPPGVPGEIWIAGVGVARGYLNRDDLTAERFVPDPFRPGSDERMYRTGDLGRYLADGNLECRGRIDSQVKVRGFRIELGEIEAALASHPGVAAAVVDAVTRGPGDVRLAAWLRSRDGSDMLPAGVREHVAQILPAYMIPQHFMTVASFPLLPNGKLDRASLPQPRWDAGMSAGAGAAEGAGPPPQTEAEKALAAIWCRLLGIERIDVDANFFDLGGHSLLVTQAVAEARQQFGVRLHPARFAVETLAQLAASLVAVDTAGAPAATTAATTTSSAAASAARSAQQTVESGPRRPQPTEQPERTRAAPASDSLLVRLRRRLAGA